MDQFAQHAFIGAKAVSRVEAPQAEAAQSAAAIGIQRKGVLEWRPATDAEEFRAQRLGRPQTCAADRDAGGSGQRPATQAAITGEEEGKKGVGGFAD
jgi:hypothetical protein